MAVSRILLIWEVWLYLFEINWKGLCLVLPDCRVTSISLLESVASPFFSSNAAVVKTEHLREGFLRSFIFYFALPVIGNHSLHPLHLPLFEGGGWKFWKGWGRGGGWMEIFKKGVKEWERGAALKRGELEDWEGAGGGFTPPPNNVQAEDEKRIKIVGYRFSPNPPTCENVTKSTWRVWNQHGEYGLYGEWNGEYVDFSLSFSSLSNKNIDPLQLKLNNQIY